MFFFYKKALAEAQKTANFRKLFYPDWEKNFKKAHLLDSIVYVFNYLILGIFLATIYYFDCSVSSIMVIVPWFLLFLLILNYLIGKKESFYGNSTGGVELLDIDNITSWGKEGLHRANSDPMKSLNDFLVKEAMEVVVLEKGFDEARFDNRVIRDSLAGVGIFWKEANAKFDRRLSELQGLFPMLTLLTRAECFKKAQAELKH